MPGVVDLALEFGDDGYTPLLTLPGVTLGPSSLAPSWAPAAVQLGPNYADALGQGATSPVWSGGAVRLTVNAFAAFQVSCAYLLVLNVYKRTIVDCNPVGDDPQQNVSYQSFTIKVNCPAS